jgi:hypothetical protein
VARGKPADELTILEVRLRERVDEIEAECQRCLAGWDEWQDPEARRDAIAEMVSKNVLFWWPLSPEQCVERKAEALKELEPLRRRVDELNAARKRERGRPKGSGRRLPPKTFFEALRLALNGTPAYRIEEITSADPELAFVNEEKASVIAKWVRANPAEARRASASREIPPIFSGNADGALIEKTA